MTFKEEMKERTEVIEKLLVKYLPKAEDYQSQIMEAMEYSVMAGGKRLRPMLMQETYRLFGPHCIANYLFMAELLQK